MASSTCSVVVAGHNVVIDGNVCKITNFAASIPYTRVPRTHKDTITKYSPPHYVPPEVLRGTVTGKADPFQVGLLLWEMACTKPPPATGIPHPNIHCDDAHNQSALGALPGDMLSVVVDALNPNHGDRPTIPELKGRIAPFATAPNDFGMFHGMCVCMLSFGETCGGHLTRLGTVLLRDVTCV